MGHPPGTQRSLLARLDIMVSRELLASVAGLSIGERVELVGYIESTLNGGALPTSEQQETVARRDAELRANPDLGLTKDQAISAIWAGRAGGA